MKALDKLSSMLCDYDLSVIDEDFTIATGYWTHKHQDCIRWEGAFRMVGAYLDSLPIIIDSWDKVSECARHGFWLVKGGAAYGQWQAIAKRPGLQAPSGMVSVEEFKVQNKI